MGRVVLAVTVAGPPSEAEALWYDVRRRPAWVDGFGHVVKLEGDWPRPGARLLWDAPPPGRGRVVEEVVAYAHGAGQAVAIEDARLRGTRSVAFASERGGVRVTVVLEYELKERHPLTALVDVLRVRRHLRESLRRTLARFAHERRADAELGAG